MSPSRIEIKEIDIPQLQRTRTLRIYLPPGYDETDQRFPVWYMHDGQNLFDPSTAFVTDWKLKIIMDKVPTSNQAIIVGIDNGSLDRINEYAPFKNKKNGSGGQGDLFLKFIVETLKPSIDTSYRTLSDKNNTIMAGSSMGGLISFYAGLVYPNIFGKIGVLSPAFWFNPKVLDLAKQYKDADRSRFYVSGSKVEFKTMEKTLQDTYDALKTGGFDDNNIRVIARDKGKHNEKFWSKEFKPMFDWL